MDHIIIYSLYLVILLNYVCFISLVWPSLYVVIFLLFELIFSRALTENYEIPFIPSKRISLHSLAEVRPSRTSPKLSILM